MYPVEIRSKGDKANLRRASRRFGIKNGQFVYDNRLVILSRDEQLRIVKDVHVGLGVLKLWHRIVAGNLPTKN